MIKDLLKIDFLICFIAQCVIKISCDTIQDTKSDIKFDCSVV